MAKQPTGWRRLVLRAPAAEAPPLPQPERSAPEPEPARIDHGVEMKGRLVVDRALRIEGEFHGELECSSSVFVGETGAVQAPIRARSLEIHGAVVGNVVATREVVIHASGRLHGDVETPCLVIERGATFNGRTRMYRPERVLQLEPAEEAPREEQLSLLGATSA
jgi:cytoskeletal protein CcmA (bactofilin family)